MADLKIYNNGENKILFSAGDRIIRQPYDFAFGFLLGSSYRMIVDLSGIGNNFEIIETYHNPSKGEVPGVRYYNMDGTYLSTAVFGNSTTWGSAYRASNIISTSYWGAHRGNQPLPTMFTFIGNSSIKFAANGITTSFTSLEEFSSSTNDSNYLSTYWGRGSSASISSIRLGRLAIFNRELSSQERIFYNNNLIYQEFQTLSGILCDLNFKGKAKILDFSLAQDGSDMKVGVEDISGHHRHGKINLPAGTLQEQLDFANANLFVPFIS